MKLHSKIRIRRRRYRSCLARDVIQISDSLRGCSDSQLLDKSQQLRSAASSHDALASMMPEAYALVREAARRAHDQAHFEVQIEAGIGLFDGGIVEMQTGEGKTLAALLPTYLYALIGKGCHVVTSNDYLARRDANFAAAVFERLGISVGCLNESLRREHRANEYCQNVTYGTAREFGFDFLKDRIANHRSGDSCAFPGYPTSSVNSVQRDHYFAIVDEADHVMIDDARTPLLIAAPGDDLESRRAMIRRCHQIATNLNMDAEFELNQTRRNSKLTNLGCRTALRQCDSNWITQFGAEQIYAQVENALAACHFFQRDRHYVVVNGEISIVDESTGRISEGRKWQNGLHQAIEARENLDISVATETLARITVQSYFRRYQHLAGLTGTATQVAREFEKTYGLKVTPIETRLPSQRNGLPDRIFADFAGKSRAIARETAMRIGTGQAVLIGTPSVRVSDRISFALLEFGIRHEVLNCREHKQEALIIKHAGLPGRVTVATNMAGRGTDIRVDPAVLGCGGLHIIATEKHTSARIDRQLIGRTARQGEPGTYQFFLSLEDELFTLAGQQPKTRIAAHATGNELGPGWIKVFEEAQRKLAKMHEQQRLDLLKREQKRNGLCRQMGLDPCLEMLDEN